MADEKKAHKGEKKSSPRVFKAGRSCPKCGAGIKLGEHKDRFSCGRCGYMEKK